MAITTDDGSRLDRHPTHGFRHGRLDGSKQQIRLARILPLDAQAPDLNAAPSQPRISCSLEVYDLPANGDANVHIEDPDYICLSYAWGDENPKQTILLNGIPFIIRQNLFDLLCAMQERQEHGNLFWIDQLCIDQECVSERNAQVEFMSEIFSRARVVYMWLGEATERTPIAMSLLEAIRNACIKAVTTTETSSGNSGLDSQTHLLPIVNEELFALGYHPSDLESLSDIFERPYWERLWIVQEVLLAESELLLCGTYEHLLSPSRCGELALFSMYLHDHFVTGPARRGLWDLHGRCGMAADLLLHCYTPWMAGHTLLDAVLMHSTRLCSDLRDKVFGLQACVRPEERLTVDYNLSTEDVFLRVAFAFETDEKGTILEGDEKPRRVALIHLRNELQLAWWSGLDIDQLCQFTGYYLIKRTNDLIRTVMQM